MRVHGGEPLLEAPRGESSVGDQPLMLPLAPPPPRAHTSIGAACRLTLNACAHTYLRQRVGLCLQDSCARMAVLWDMCSRRNVSGRIGVAARTRLIW